MTEGNIFLLARGSGALRGAKELLQGTPGFVSLPVFIYIYRMLANINKKEERMQTGWTKK